MFRSRNFVRLYISVRDNPLFRSHQLLDQLRKKAQFFRHNHVLYPFGDDFRFSDKSEWKEQISNLTRLFDYMNRREDMNVQARSIYQLICLNMLPDYNNFLSIVRECFTFIA